MAVKYLRLFDPTQQFQLKGGQLNVAGRLYVHLEATDDLAALYDENGSQLSQPVILDNNGRAAGLFVDSAQVYWLDVQDRYGMSQFTIRKMTPCGGGGGSLLGSTYNVVSSDGSIDVDKSEDAGVTTFDIGIAPNDSDEFLEWIKCSEEDCGSTWKPFYQDGTMETDEDGVKVHGGHLYHFTSTFYVDPNGTGINYDTFKVIMYCNDEIVDTRYFDIDSSLNDSVQCEFSTDVIPSEDGHVYYKLTIPSTCEVTGELQCHRIYSGINAVPDTCATKQWVQETFDYNMAEKISYSALEYNGNGDISGISGSAIAGGLDSAAVSSIASSYAESAISSISGWSGDFSLDEKLDKSASSEFQPSGQYVYESAYSSFSSEVTNNISSISSTVSGLTGQYIEQSASSMFQPSGNYASASDLSAYVPFSGLEGEGGKVTGISGSAFKGHEYTGINPVTVDNTADTISVEHRTLCVDSTMNAYNSGSSAVIGVNVAGLDLSSKMDASASSLLYPMDNPSGYITGVDLTPYQLTADMSAYAHESSLSAKLDASASSEFYSTSNPSGFLTAHQSLAGYATETYVDSAVSGKLDATAYDSAEFYTTANPSGFVDSAYVESQVSGKQNSGNYISAKGLTQTITNAAGTSAIAFGAYGAGAQSSTEKPGIYLTGEFGTAYYKDNELNLNRADMKIAFNIGGQGPKISSMATGTRHSYMYLFASGQKSGTYSETGIEFKDSGNNTVALYDSSTYGNITSVYDTVSANSASWGQGGVDSATVSSIASSYAESAASSKLDASASSDFYSTANPSGFLTGVDLTPYQLTADMSGYYTTANESGFIDSAYVEGQVSGKQDASAMTAYQPAGDYQPSGDYIYVSALGWAEV